MRDASIPDVGLDASNDANESDDAYESELNANAGASFYALVGEEVTLDASESTGATAYLWNFGDGRSWDEPRDTPIANATYDEPGRYQAVVTAYDSEGRTRSDSVVVTVTHPATWQPRQSSTLSVTEREGVEYVGVVAPDADRYVIFESNGQGYEEALDGSCELPGTIAFSTTHFFVTCRGDSTLLKVTWDGDVETISFGYGSHPFGVIVASDGTPWVTLWAKESLVRFDGSTPVEVADVPDPRHLAELPDGRIAVSRWRSPDERGEVYLVGDSGAAILELAFDPQPASDTETGGVPTYLGPLAVSPDAREAIIASMQANIDHGLYRNGRPHLHEDLMRAVLSFVDLTTMSEKFERRKQYDDRGFANDAVYSPRGDFVWVAMRGNRTVERFDVLNSSESGTIFEVGFAPESIALSKDGRRLFVDAALSREVRVYDVTNVADTVRPIHTMATVEEEPLETDLLRGKILFNDAQDPRLTRDGYVACAHCHLDGLSDNRTWDFTDRGEGIRNTTSLVGRGGDAHGPIHWSGNFDEIHDFENDIRGPFAGTGLMSDDEFAVGTRAEPLGDTKAGISDDLDALAAYVASLECFESPYRRSDGTLTASAQAGKAIFESNETGCTDCHSGPRMTDSQWLSPGVPLLHDVGTMTSASGDRLGEPLVGIDTPTLHGLWNSAPYLHDGSAPDLRTLFESRNAVDSHGATSSLTDDELEQLMEFLLSLDRSNL